MIIQSSSTNLSATRSYSSKYQTVQTLEQLSGTGKTTGDGGSSKFLAYFVNGVKQNLIQETGTEEATEESKQQEENTESDGTASGGQTLSELLQQYQNTQSVKTASLSDKIKQIQNIRQSAIDYLLEILFGRTVDGTGMSQSDTSEDTLSDLTSQVLSAGSTSTWSSGIATSTVAPTLQSYRQTTYFHYEENESVDFSAQGKVITADGREMDFNLEVNLSRSFVEDTKDFYDYSLPVYTDPLVIQLDGSLPSVSDMKFYFDLDSDGEEEEMSMLGENNGFLALDKNEDGTINDGSELFGTDTGNGFHELSTYDVDRNGWIDEADEVFDKLRIWMKEEDGSDKLLTLKEAGVGAINLDCVDTRFAYNDKSNNTNAIARKSGFFLYESGETGSMQQLDMAT